MIVPATLKNSYLASVPVWEKIQNESDAVLDNIAKRHGGTYTSRIKPLESAVLKIEKEEYAIPFFDMEDMLAGSIIVPVLSEIIPTKVDVEREFVVDEIRPLQVPDPEKFGGAYDLHLILKLKDSPYRIEKGVLNFRFEIQIKTFLQHAWSKAGHDIIYKPKRMSYGLVRIASQVRALLELADNVLANIESAAQLQIEPDYPKYTNSKRIIEIMEKHWETSRLPADRRRAAGIIQRYMELAKISTPDYLDTIISEPRYADFFQLRSVTPTQTIFIILFIAKNGNIPKIVEGNSKVLITEEMMDICPLLSRIPAANRISVSSQSADSIVSNF
jgi:ppGpp synthetase/RelA/SpoT-type nucleotidyltranferase